MNPIPNPDSWMDVFTILAVAAMAGVPSWFALRNHKGIHDIRDKTEDIKSQVVNGHADAPPLRADIDRLLACVHALGADISSLREELVAEAGLRRQQVQDLRDDVDHRFDDNNRHRRRDT